MFDIHNGDCADVMASMESNSVDAIVTDPPYGLEFMGAGWDAPWKSDDHVGNTWNSGMSEVVMADGYKRLKRPSFENTQNVRCRKCGKWKLSSNPCTCAEPDFPNIKLNNMHTFQQYMTPIFEEALRVAKPGAHLLCFGGTRTFHRMACAIEDAGWEIRDCIMWVYGCLDEETEVLVDGEFVPYADARVGNMALGYDIGTGNFSWQRIEDTYLYDYDDTAYAIQSDSTDQLVSRNHRCIVERCGVEQFALAELVALEREASVPVLEGLHGLLDRLPLPECGTGDTEQDVLEGVRCESRELGTEEAQGSRAERDVCDMRQEVLYAASMDTEGKRTSLFEEVQRQGSRDRATEAQQKTSREDGENRGADSRAARENDGREEPIVEWRGNVSPSQRQLREREVRSMPQGVRVDGSQGRVRDGASSGSCASNRQTAYSDGSCSSHQPRSVGQQAREPDVVSEQQRAQALRGAWGTKTTLARVTPVHYKGKMWCIKVATGAFVARRHGKIFVTGNSGFPKSMDVSKAIEKKHGADAAAQWDGWGTCLKPAWEPIIIARKPLDGTVANNVLTWGVGALNIDGCRVPIEQGDDVFAKNPHTRSKGKDSGIYGTYGAAESNWSGAKGRFPANLVHDGSQMVLDLFPESKGQQARVAGNEPSRTGDNGIYGHYGPRNEFNPRNDSGSAARFFYCAKASKNDRNYGCERLLTWAERDQELTQLLEQASNLLARDISESMMLNLVEQGCSTSLFGNENTVLSQEECRFITSTVIPLITASKTCSSSPRSNTSESILDAIRTSEESGISLARLADKSSQSRQDFTSSGTDTATSAVSALFGVLSEIRGRARVGNFHCTVKPIALMRWLVTLVTPEGGVVLDPFAGSGTTLVACKELGRSCIGIEREPEYVEIIKRRLGE